VITASSSTLQNSAILLLTALGQEAVGAAQDDVGRDADRAQLLHRVLHGLGLELARGADVGTSAVWM
jgi:hypothetical protein